MREEDCSFQRISDRVAQAALSLQPWVLRCTRRVLWVHEQQHTEFLCLGPERIELAVGEFLALDAASDGGAAQSQLSDGLVQLIGCQIRMLQRHSGHSYKSIRMLGTPLRYSFILKLNKVASQRAFCRVSPGIDIDRLIVNALRIHIDQPLRIAERDVTGKIALRCCGERRVLDQIPDFGHETVGVSVHGLYATASDEYFAALAWRRSDLERRKAAADGYSGRCGCGILEEVSAVWHVLSFGKRRCCHRYGMRQTKL